MNIPKFFKDNPECKFVLKVGDQFYLKHAEAQAKNYARISGAKLEKIKNPNLKEEKKEEKKDATPQPTAKEKLQAEAKEMGIEFKSTTTVKDLKKLIAAKKEEDKNNSSTNKEK